MTEQATATATATAPSLEELRTHFLKKQKPARRSAVLFGVDVDLVQPSLARMLEIRDALDEDTPQPTSGGIKFEDDESEQTPQPSDDGTAKAMALGIVRFVCMEGTEERIFTEDDIDTILEWPFSSDLADVQLAITQMSGFDVDEAKEGMARNPLEDS